MNLVIDDTDHPLIIKVATLQSSRMQVYFIDNDDYFQHHAVTDLEIRETPGDNDERMMFFRARGNGNGQETTLGTGSCALFRMGDSLGANLYEEAICR